MEWADVLKFIEPFIFIPVVSLASLAVVYIFGRMLGLVHRSKVKNLLALICIIGGMWLYLFVYRDIPYTTQRILEGVMFTLFTILFYVLFCFRLFDRVDRFFDKYAKDKGEPVDPPKKRTRTKKS